MANWSDLKAAVASIVKTNGDKEITGQLLQNVLNNIISNVGLNSSFAGIATPETNPGVPDGNVFYLATTAGTYSNFNGIVINTGEAVILEWKGSWTKKASGFATKEELSELGSKLSVISFEGKGEQSVFTNVLGILPNITYRVYIKNRWTVPANTDVYFELYYRNDDGSFKKLHSVNSQADVLKDYYDVVLPEGKDLIIWAKIAKGETATFVIEKMDTTIKDINFQRNALNTYITGKGVYSSARFRGVNGRTYRIYLPNKWNYSEGDVVVFYIGKVIDGAEKELLRINSNNVSALREYYDITFEENVDYITVGGNCIEGENIFVIIDDITDTISNLGEANIVGFNNLDMSIIGSYIPIKKAGYIASDSNNFSNPVFSANFRHVIIPCKVGDIYFIKAKGGNEVNVYRFYDEDFNIVSSAFANSDYSVKGIYVGAYRNGYLVVNANVGSPYNVLKVNKNLQQKMTEVLDMSNHVIFYDGFINYKNGERQGGSGVNKATGYIPTLGYGKISISVNNTTIENTDSGLVFYDAEGNYISGVQSIYSTEQGVSVEEYLIPTNACYVRSTIYATYEQEFICRLFNDEKKEEAEEESLQTKTYLASDLKWSSGYVGYYSGELGSSSVNSIAEIDVENYANIELTVNKTAIGASPGICFYDKDGKFIIGFPYPDFGDSTATPTYVVKRYSIPYNAAKAKVSFYTNNLAKFEATIYKETARGYNAISKVSNITDSVLDNIQIGSPQLYISEKTAEAYTSLDSKSIDELYSRWDSLVETYPMFIKRGNDLGKVNDGTRDYVVRQYIIGYNGRYMIDHEPSQNEVVSSNKWRNTDNPRKILINNGMHGNEKTPCWGAMLAFEELLESNEAWANYIKANFELYIIPCLNPYGFHKNSRANINGVDLNRDAGINEPERLMYMQWVSNNADAFALIDNHGSQGRYAYVPVWAGQPIFSYVNKMAANLSASLYQNYREFYNTISEGYGEMYAPFLVAKYSVEASYGRCANEMLERFGMAAFALETPDNLVVTNSDGSVNTSLSGLIQYNDLRCCKITKDLLINFIQNVGVMKYNKII